MRLLPDFDFLKYNPFNLGNHFSEILLVCGNSIHVVSASENSRLVDISKLDDVVKQSLKPILLLATPYMHSLVQETIPLKRSELVIADSQILAFSRFEKEDRVLESIPLDQQTAVTSFSHLSPKGKEIVHQAKQSKRLIPWYPAISFLVRQLINFPFATHNVKTLQFDLGAEALIIAWQDRIPRFKHVNNWTTDSNPSSFLNRIDLLTASENRSTPIRRISFNETHSVDSSTFKVLNTIFFTRKKIDSQKPVIKRTKQRRSHRLLKIPPLYLVLAATLILIIWTIQVNYTLLSLKSNHSALQHSVTALLVETQDLEQIAENERSHFKTQAFVVAVNKNQVDSVLLVKKLESQMPSTAWIQSITLSRLTIRIVILDSKESNLTETLENISKEIGDVHLEENIKTSLNDTILFKRTLIIHLLEKK